MTSQSDLPPLPSNRKFGTTFALVFAFAAVYSYFRDAAAWPAALALLALLFGAATLIAPGWLEPLNNLWMRFGLLLGKIVSPIVLGLVFFLVITPVSWIARLRGRDALAIRKRNVPSYWVERQPPGPASDSFRNPF
jgi:hypothetical protein